MGEQKCTILNPMSITHFQIVQMSHNLILGCVCLINKVEYGQS